MPLSDAFFHKNRVKSNLLLILFGGGVLLYPIASFTIFKSYYLFITFSFFVTILINEWKGLLPIGVFLQRASALILLFIILLITSFTGINLNHSLIEIFWASIYFLNFYIFATCVAAYSPKKISVIFKLSIIVTTLVNVILLLKFGMVRADPDTKGQLGAYSSHMPMFMTTALLYSIWGIITGNKREKLIQIFFAFFAVFNILLSLSRAGILVFFLIVFLLPFVFTFNLKNLFFNYIKIGFVILFLTFLFWLIPFGREKINTLKDRFAPIAEQVDKIALPKHEISQKETIRVLMYNYGFHLVKDNVFFGIGYGNFKDAMASEYRGGKKPHNLLLEIISYGGIIAFIISIWLIFICFYKLKWLKNYYNSVNDTNNAIWYNINILVLFSTIVFAQFKPTLENPIFYFPIAVALFSKVNASKK